METPATTRSSPIFTLRQFLHQLLYLLREVATFFFTYLDVVRLKGHLLTNFTFQEVYYLSGGPTGLIHLPLRYQLLLFVLLYNLFLRLFIFLFTSSLSLRLKILLIDMTVIPFFQADVNGILLFLYCLNLFFFYHLYVSSGYARMRVRLDLVGRMLFPELNPNQICPWAEFRRTFAYLPAQELPAVNERARQIAAVAFLNVMQPISFLMYVTYGLGVFHVIAQMWEDRIYYLTSISGLASLPLIVWHGLIVTSGLSPFGILGITMAFHMASMAILLLGHFNLAMSLLPKTGRQVPKRGLNVDGSLERFFQAHRRTFLFLLDCNRASRWLFLGFLAGNFPVNAYILVSILRGKYSLLTFTAMLPVTLSQIFISITFHLLGAMFTKRIHACTPLLFACNANCSQRHLSVGKAVLSMRVRLRLNAYLGAFHAKKRYGLTYGTLGVIQMMTFTKFWLMYGELLMSFYSTVSQKY